MEGAGAHADAAGGGAAGSGGGGSGDQGKEASNSAATGSGAKRTGSTGPQAPGKETGAKPKVNPKKGKNKKQASSGAQVRGAAPDGTGGQRSSARLTERTAALAREDEKMAQVAKDAAAKASAFQQQQQQQQIAQQQQQKSQRLQQKQTSVADFYKKKPEPEKEKTAAEVQIGSAGRATTAAPAEEDADVLRRRLLQDFYKMKPKAVGAQARSAEEAAAATSAATTAPGRGGAEEQALSGAASSLTPGQLAAINTFLSNQRQATEGKEAKQPGPAAMGEAAAVTTTAEEKDSRDTVNALLEAAAEHHRSSSAPSALKSQDDGYRVVGKGGRTYAMGERVPERHQRAETPFKNPDAEEYRRSRLAYRPRQALVPSDKQRDWASKGLCVGCGGYHSVFDPICKARLSKEQAKATLNAIRYGDGGGRKTKQQQQQHQSAGLQARSAPLIPPQVSGAGSKRPRESGTGTTPEAKRGTYSARTQQSLQQQQRQQQDPELTLCVREKDNAPLTAERNGSLQSSINERLFQEFYMNNRMPPKINRWDRSNLVLKITMRDLGGLAWMRRALEGSYQIQSIDDYKRSRGKVFIAFLQDRFNPGITGLSRATLAKIVEIEATAMGIKSLLELKLAAKVPSGLALHLIMDEEAERIFAGRDCKLDILSAGGVQFRDERLLRAQAREARLKRLKPLPATPGQLVQQQREQQTAEEGLSSLSMASSLTGTPDNPLTVEDSPTKGTDAGGAEKDLRWADEVEAEKKGGGEEGEEKEKEGEMEGEEKEKDERIVAHADGAEEATGGEGDESMELGKEETEELHANSQDMMEAYLLAQDQGQEPMSQDE